MSQKQPSERHVKGCEKDLVVCVPEVTLPGPGEGRHTGGSGWAAEARSETGVVTLAKDVGCLNQPSVGMSTGKDVQELKHVLYRLTSEQDDGGRLSTWRHDPHSWVEQSRKTGVTRDTGSEM